MNADRLPEVRGTIAVNDSVSCIVMAESHQLTWRVVFMVAAVVTVVLTGNVFDLQNVITHPSPTLTEVQAFGFAFLVVMWVGVWAFRRMLYHSVVSPNICVERVLVDPRRSAVKRLRHDAQMLQDGRRMLMTDPDDRDLFTTMRLTRLYMRDLKEYNARLVEATRHLNEIPIGAWRLGDPIIDRDR